MKDKKSILSTFNSFSEQGLINADKIKYRNINLIIGENGSGKTRFLKSLQNELKSYSSKYVITLFFPELVENSVLSSSNDNEVYVFDIIKDNVDLSFTDFVKVIESAPDRNDFINDFQNWMNTRALKEREMAVTSFENINKLLGELINRKIEFDENGNAYICKIINENVRKCEIVDAFSYPEMSPGEKILFDFCLFLYYIQNHKKDIIILIDEPECHLHPNKLIYLITKLQQFVYIDELWIASHSLYLVPLFEFDNIVLIENNIVTKRNSGLYKKIYNVLVGDENLDIFEFLKSIDSWMYYNWIVEMFALPNIVDGLDNNDEQFKIIYNYCNEIIQKNNTLKILDYGAGKCRIFDCLEMSTDNLSGLLEYDAFEPYPDECYEYNENIRLFTDSKEIPKDTYHIIIMMNVLHEIPVDEWNRVFHLLGNSLLDDGKLVLIEVKNLTHGEQPYGNNGFLLLNDEAVRKCFPSAKVISFEENKSNAWVIDKMSLVETRPDQIVEAITVLKTKTKNELRKAYFERIKYAKANRTDEIEINARKYAFISQQYINSEFALETLSKLGNDGEKSPKRIVKKPVLQIVPPPINRKDKFEKE